MKKPQPMKERVYDFFSVARYVQQAEPGLADIKDVMLDYWDLEMTRDIFCPVTAVRCGRR